MSAFDRVLAEESQPKEACVSYGGVDYRFRCEDPGRIAGEILLIDPDSIVGMTAQFSAITGRKVERQIVSNCMTILATWANDEKTTAIELVKVFLKKPELFLALFKAADSVVTVDAELMAYAMGANATQDARDAANPLVRSGLGNSSDEAIKPQDSSTL